MNREPLVIHGKNPSRCKEILYKECLHFLVFLRWLSFLVVTGTVGFFVIAACFRAVDFKIPIVVHVRPIDANVSLHIPSFVCGD